jgi:hypothetical protein
MRVRKSLFDAFLNHSKGPNWNGEEYRVNKTLTSRKEVYTESVQCLFGSSVLSQTQVAPTIIAISNLDGGILNFRAFKTYVSSF